MAISAIAVEIFPSKPQMRGHYNCINVEIFQFGPKKLISQHHILSCSQSFHPKLWNRCFSLAAHFGILLCAAPSASQMSEVKHVISEVGRRLPLCSITWYLLQGSVNKHRCNVCVCVCVWVGEAAAWMQLSPDECNFCHHKGWIHTGGENWAVGDNERTVCYIPECVGSNQCRVGVISPSAGFCKYSNCFVISKGQIVLFNLKYIWLTGDA